MNNWSWHRQLLALIAVCLLSTSCGGESAPTAEPLRGWDSEVVDEGAELGESATTQSIDLEPSVEQEPVLEQEHVTEQEDVVAETIPDSVAMVEPDDDDRSLLPGLPRTTNDGIVISTELDMVDYGDGPVEDLFLIGRAGSGMAGTTIDENYVADTPGLGWTNWAASGGVMVMRIETADHVTRVVLTGLSTGSQDAGVPHEGLLHLAVLASGPEDVSVEAFDVDGTLIGTCAQGELFLDCDND